MTQVKRSEGEEGVTPLLAQLRQLIADARKQALRAVDSIQVRTCWEIGRHIVEFEQGGQARATYGKGFDERNLRHMRAFFLCFPIWNAVRSELSWTHYRLLTRVDNEAARLWYMREAAEQNWNTRALDRQIGTLYYERLLLSQDKASVVDEARQNLAQLPQSPRAFVRDPVMLEFLGLPGAGKLLESGLERKQTAVCQPLQTGAAVRGRIAPRAGTRACRLPGTGAVDSAAQASQ